MAIIRIHEIAKEAGFSSKEVLEKAAEMGLDYKSPSNGVSAEIANAIYEFIATGTILPVVAQEVAKKQANTKSASTKTKSNKNAKTTKSTKSSVKKPEKTESEQAKANKNLDTKTQNAEIKTSQKEEKEAKEQPVIASIEKETKNDETPNIKSDFEQRKRGLVIVKKKNARTNEEARPSSAAVAARKEPMSFASIFAASEENLKKKKAKKAAPAQKRENAARMEFDSNFADFSYDDDASEVVLPDLTVVRSSMPEPSRASQQPSTKNSYTQQAAFGNNPTGIARRGRKKSKFYKKDASKDVVVSQVQIPKEIRLYELAEKLKKRDSELISVLFKQGMMTTKNDFLDEEVIELLGLEFGIDITFFDEAAEFDYEAHYEDAQDELLDSRVPVVTIMGHVDHGKTSLLDYIRNSRVASGEAGGITQHVGAYMVSKNERNITFIDTPGHEAFSAMRARGASVTDIAIIVVAADDGVKPQTKEAINHAKSAGVPIIVAINKIDKEAANPDNVKAQMAELEIMPTEWGGEHEFVEISARTGQGIEDLLEIILLQADLLELKANASAAAKANIVESSLQKGRGVVTTVIMQNGTLRQGDTVVAGIAYGRVKSISDSRGNILECIRPGECGVIMGLNEIPDAGETLISVATDKEAREYAQKRHEYLRQKELSKSTKVSLDELSAKIKEGNLKSLPLILKADVGGTLEAIKSSLEKLSNDEVRVDIIHGAVGGISAGDISLAQAAGGVIVGFNVRPTGEIKESAKAAKVEIKTYNVIYNLIDEIKAILGGLMSPIISEEQLGQAQIRQVINVPKIGQIAGCMVTDGSIVRGAKIRVIRDGVVVFEGEISSLKRFKDDAKEVAKGYECGVGIEGFSDMREGDFIESYKEVENQVVL